MIFGIFNYTCCVCEVCCFLSDSVTRQNICRFTSVCSCKRDVCLGVCDASTHVKRGHMEGKGGHLLKEGVEASWQQISDYGFRAVFVKVQWDFPCKGYNIGPKMTDLPPPCKAMCSA